jgi:hypothetical protein
MALEYPFELPATLLHSIGMPINTRIDEATLEDFAKALMVVSGSDDHLSVWERGWLSAYLSAYGASPALLTRIEDFDYKDEKLETYLVPLLEGEYSRWVRRSLLQGAIRMARADTVATEEAASIQRVGAMLGMSEDTVEEIISLVEMFDSVTSTNAVLLSIAEKEDAEELLKTQQMQMIQDSWDAEPTDGEDTVVAPNEQVMERSLVTFARALLFVAAADGDISEQEMDFLRAYLHTWGASPNQIEVLLSIDPYSITAEKIVEEAYSLSWGLKALTIVALRTASADGLAQEEENAILELYRLTGRSIMHYYAAKGLEEIRERALERLNTIFARHNPH